MKAVVFDLDGTLANIDHRVHLVRCEKPDYKSFFKSCVNDTPNEWCADLIRILRENPNYHVLIVTARDKMVEGETRDWLERYDLAWNVELVMVREHGDHTPDVELKRRWLREFGPQNILFVVDDRERVVRMWREEGVTCLQCAQWDEFKKQRGT